VTGVLAYLHTHGVRLKHITRANLLVAPDLSVRLYDPEIESVSDEAQNGVADELRSFGAILRRFCDAEALALVEFMESVENGDYSTPSAFGRAIEQRFDGFAGITYRPLLGAMSDVGLIRQLNEDNWGWRKLSGRSALYVVADGMGGHESGEVASMLAVETICRIAQEREAVASPGIDAVENLLDEAFQTANNTIKDQAEERGTDMGTTLVSTLILEGKMAFIANVGDSRAYLMRNDALHQVSRDHSLVAKMVEKGRITADEARSHPHSNILLRTVGTEHDVDIDLFRVDLEGGDRILLCSDGLWGEVEDRQIEEILRYNLDPRFAARELIRAAHQGGGKDNVTLLVITVP
jgi:protein phosphatase